MLDLFINHHRIEIVDQEDRALLRSNPSAWSMPEDGQEHVSIHMLLPSRSSFGYKAINLFRKYGTTGPLIVKGRHKPIKLMRQGGT